MGLTPFLLIVLRFAVPIPPGQDHAFRQAQQFAALCGAEITRKGTESPPSQAFRVSFAADGRFVAHSVEETERLLVQSATSPTKAFGFAQTFLSGIMDSLDNVASIRYALHTSDDADADPMLL